MSGTVSETDSRIPTNDTHNGEAGAQTKFQVRKEVINYQPKSFDSFIEEARDRVPPYAQGQ